MKEELKLEQPEDPIIPVFKTNAGVPERLTGQAYNLELWGNQ